MALAYAPMTTWEYKVLVLPAAHYEVDEEILGLHGERGWELTNVLLDGQGYRVAYLKRALALEAPATLDEAGPLTRRGETEPA